MGKCSICGAPMKNGICEYCGHEEKQPEPVQKQAASQPQVIIQNIHTGCQQTHTMNGQGAWNGSGSIERRAVSTISVKNRWLDFGICLISGFFGFHKIYEGKYGMAVLYFFTFGLFLIGWFVDLVRIASGNATDSYGRLIK